MAKKYWIKKKENRGERAGKKKTEQNPLFFNSREMQRPSTKTPTFTKLQETRTPPKSHQQRWVSKKFPKGIERSAWSW